MSLTFSGIVAKDRPVANAVNIPLPHKAATAVFTEGRKVSVYLRYSVSSMSKNTILGFITFSLAFKQPHCIPSRQILDKSL
ncbi:hypothetical protein NM43_2095 [Neisseria meningitidis NM43]|nr:hypothetical protein NM43_2095 [Neisseria meningitidis NM43]